MLKRGQAAAFMVMGILILFLVGLLYALQEKQIPTFFYPKEEQTVETKTVQTFVQQCFEQAIGQGLTTVLGQGGYYEFPASVKILHDNLSGIEVPYYFYQGAIALPPLEFIAQETGKGISASVKTCVGEFSAFKNQGLDITQKDAITTVLFSEQETRVALVFPLTIDDGAKTMEMRFFSAVIPFSFKEKYQEVFSYLIRQQESSEDFLAGELSSRARKGGYDFGFKQQGQTGENIILAFSYDSPFKMGNMNKNMVYQFSLQFGWGALLEPAEQHETLPPLLVLERIPVWNITQEGEHTLQLRARGEGLTFALQPENGPELNSATGFLRLDTTLFPNDEYLYYVEVTDKHSYRVLAPLIIDVHVSGRS